MNRQLVTLSVIALGLATATAPSLAEPPSAPSGEHCHGHQATIVGTSGDDTLRGTPKRDVIVGLGGNDVIRAKAGNDLVCGGEGTDRLFGGHGNDYLNGQQNSDVLTGGRGDDRIIDRRNDRHQDEFFDWVGEPNVFVDGAGSDVMKGRDRKYARDTLSFKDSPAGVNLVWDSGVAHAANSTNRFVGIDMVLGSPYGDQLTGRDDAEQSDTIFGRGGNDVIRGQAGSDFLSAGAPYPGGFDGPHHPPGRGHERLIGGSGNDTLLPGGDLTFRPGDSRVWSRGGSGNDRIAAGPYGGRLDAGPGSDELYVHAHRRIQVALTTGRVKGMALRFSNAERHHFDVVANGSSVVGTDGPDYVDARGGQFAAFRLVGKGGDDELYASGTIDGGDGDDQIHCAAHCDVRAGRGSDRVEGRTATRRAKTVRGGPGDDSISWASGPAFGGPGDDEIAMDRGSAPVASVFGGQGDDALRLKGYAMVAELQRLSGGTGSDSLDLSDYWPDADTEPRGVHVDLTAGSMSDAPGTTTALDSIENLTGSTFADVLVGDGQDNVLTGGEGPDSADGRGGTDTCAAETVTNCEG